MNCLRLEGSSVKTPVRAKSRSGDERKKEKKFEKREKKETSRKGSRKKQNPIHTHTTNNRAVSDFHSLFHPLTNFIFISTAFRLVFLFFMSRVLVVFFSVLDGKETLLFFHSFSKKKKRRRFFRNKRGERQ